MDRRVARKDWQAQRVCDCYQVFLLLQNGTRMNYFYNISGSINVVIRNKRHTFKLISREIRERTWSIRWTSL